MTANISRRRLIESSIVGTAALAGATSAFASKPVAKWDETVDIIVVGSGFAGLAAAIEAKNAGANVIVLEKMAVFGGNSAINGGYGLSAAKASRHQGLRRPARKRYSGGRQLHELCR